MKIKKTIARFFADIHNAGGCSIISQDYSKRNKQSHANFKTVAKEAKEVETAASASAKKVSKTVAKEAKKVGTKVEKGAEKVKKTVKNA